MMTTQYDDAKLQIVHLDGGAGYFELLWRVFLARNYCPATDLRVKSNVFCYRHNMKKKFRGQDSR